MCSPSFTSIRVVLLFPLSITVFFFAHGFKIDEVLSIKSSANLFVF